MSFSMGARPVLLVGVGTSGGAGAARSPFVSTRPPVPAYPAAACVVAEPDVFNALGLRAWGVFLGAVRAVHGASLGQGGSIRACHQTAEEKV